MNKESMIARAPRFVPNAHLAVAVAQDGMSGTVENLSLSGVACALDEEARHFERGERVQGLAIRSPSDDIVVGAGTVARTYRRKRSDGTEQTVVAIAFEHEQPELIARLADSLRPPALPANDNADAPRDARTHGIDQYYRRDSSDLFAKCDAFGSWVGGLSSHNIYQRLYRLTATSGLDHDYKVFDPITRTERDMACFDSNSYLGLHRHPKVIERVTEVLREVGYGSPSAQLLSGTNRYLRQLEDALSEFHGRSDTIVFPTGFAANVGTIQALIRPNDAVLRDRHAHASIQDGCKVASPHLSKIFAHNDTAALDAALSEVTERGAQGKLVITDGVFSMHGRIAPVPELLQVCQRHGARLMVDDAHGVGVLGENGRGVEEHFDMVGEVDILMGTLSKALGAVGGYVSGSRAMVDYLRWFALAGMFTTCLPAATCAGVTMALKLVGEEPEHRARLWENIHYLTPRLAAAGFLVPPPESPILTVFLGAQPLMLQFSCELFDAGIKVGNVMFPAVAKNESILRLTLNARHSRAQLDHVVSTLTRLGKKYDILGRSREEIQEIGKQFAAQIVQPPVSKLAS